jgi:thiaminase
MIVSVDADHVYDLVTRRSITGILVMLTCLLIGYQSARRQLRHQLMAQNDGFKDCYGTHS